MVTEVDNTETKSMFQVPRILKTSSTEGYGEASSQKAGRKWHFWQQLLTTKEPVTKLSNCLWSFGYLEA